MKKRNRIVTFITSLILISCLVVDIRITALAADTTLVEMDRLGTITVSLKKADLSKVKNSALIVYQVAELVNKNGKTEYQYTDDFAECKETLKVDDYKLAGQLAEYVKKNSIKGSAASVNNEGKVVIDKLKLGLYLVVQTSTSKKYYTFNPFLVTIPYDKNGEIVYEVDAGPKVEIVVPDKPQKNGKTKKTEVPKKTGGLKKTDGKLPQTGQLNWPIPVLAISGLILLFSGQLITKKQKKCIENEV